MLELVTDAEADNANGTAFEHDIMGTQLRHGGDILGLIDSLDYIQGMGVKSVYLAGSSFMNLPWQSDGESPEDPVDGLWLTHTSLRVLPCRLHSSRPPLRNH